MLSSKQSLQPINLYQAKKHSNLQLASVPQIPLLESMGLRIGTKVNLQNRYALGGPVLLRVEDAYSIALGKDIAQQIAVNELPVAGCASAAVDTPCAAVSQEGIS